MKKLYRASFAFLILGLAAGVFYRELTRSMGYTGETALSVLHTHTLVLGMVMMLIFLILEHLFSVSREKGAKVFFPLYVSSLSLLLTMLGIRGVIQVFETDISSALNASIAGISGISHIGIGAAFVLYFVILGKAIKRN
jgi:hypothetical protein